MKKLRSLALTLLFTFSLFTSTSFAKFSDEILRFEYSDIKITLDGEEVIPKNVKGSIVEPFVIGGTRYLPVRAISESLGMSVSWNGDTHTVSLKSGEPRISSFGNSNTGTFRTGYEYLTVAYRDIKIVLDGETVTPQDENGTAVEPFIFAGTTYLPVRAVSAALGLDVEWDGTTGTIALTTPNSTPDPEPDVTPEPTPEPTTEPEPTPDPDPDPEEHTVYITPTGERYHYDSSCNGGTYIRSSLAEARKKDLTPCQKCVK